MHLLFIISFWKLLDISIWSRWIRLFLFSPSAAVEPTRGLALALDSWSEARSQDILPLSTASVWPYRLANPSIPLHVAAVLCSWICRPRRRRSDVLRAVCCCSMFRSTFKGPPAGLDHYKNRSTPQRYCFSTPRPIWGRAVCLCWHILQILPVREHKKLSNKQCNAN